MLAVNPAQAATRRRSACRLRKGLMPPRGYYRQNTIEVPMRLKMRNPIADRFSGTSAYCMGLGCRWGTGQPTDRGRRRNGPSACGRGRPGSARGLLCRREMGAVYSPPPAAPIIPDHGSPADRGQDLVVWLARPLEAPAIPEIHALDSVNSLPEGRPPCRVPHHDVAAESHSGAELWVKMAIRDRGDGKA